jgi:serpin B
MTTILGLTADGARGKTLAEMDKVLHIDNTDALHTGIASIAHQLAGAKDANRPYQLSIANALWQATDCPFKPDFRTLAEKFYDTVGVTTLDFRANPEAARAVINKWVEDKTQTKIKDILPPRSIDGSTALVLANAIYFKGTWQTQFTVAGLRGRGGTTNQAFHVTPDKDVQTPMMVNGGQFQYFEDDDVQVVSLPYKAGADRQVVSMLVVLPKNSDGLAAVEKGLSPEGIGAWIAGLNRRTTRVWLPRFTITAASDLTKVLPEMGMVEAFDKNNAHLEALGTPPIGMNLYISHVFHKAFVDVNEEGTEAAAATVVVAGAGGGAPQNVAMFRADHPFLFFIRFEPTNSILFMGHVVEPSPADPKIAAGPAGPAPRPGPAAPALKDAKAVAAAALELIKATRLDTAYVSNTVHPAIQASLNGLETAANAVADDDGKDPSISAQRAATLSATLARATTLAGQMATRPNETQESKDKSAQLQTKLTEVAGK